MLISDERLVMVVGGVEKKSDVGIRLFERQSNENIRMETCCIKNMDIAGNSLPNSRLDMVETPPHRCGRRESGGGKLRVTFSEEELEIHEDDEDVANRERRDNKCARWSKLSRPPYLGWDNPFSPTGSISQDADLIVRFWKEKKLSNMYCEILEEDEVIEIKEIEDSTNTMIEDHKNGQKESETFRIIESNKERDNNSEPEKFKTSCCSIS